MVSRTVTYNPLDPATLNDPYPVYAAMRATGTACWNQQLDSWVLTSYQDCCRVLRDHENFAADWRRAGETVPDIALNIHSTDPPEHTAIYTVLADALRHMLNESLTARVRSTVAGMLDTLPTGPVDMVTEFTEPLARWFITETTGLPLLDLATMGPIAEAMTRALDSGLVPEAREPGKWAQWKLSELIETWLAEMDPTQPLRAMVDRATNMGVPRHVTINSLRTLAIVGFTQVPASLGNALHAIAREKIVLKEYLNDAAVLDRAPHEFVRYEAPLQGTTRLCVSDTELAGVRVRRGQGVLVLFAAANRDPARFPDPDRIQLNRSPNPHLAFGHGAHGCSGFRLAHLLLHTVLIVLAQRAVTFRLAGPVRHKPVATLRTLATLPLELAS